MTVVRSRRAPNDKRSPGEAFRSMERVRRAEATGEGWPSDGQKSDCSPLRSGLVPRRQINRVTSSPLHLCKFSFTNPFSRLDNSEPYGHDAEARGLSPSPIYFHGVLECKIGWLSALGLKLLEKELYVRVGRRTDLAQIFRPRSTVRISILGVKHMTVRFLSGMSADYVVNCVGTEYIVR